MSNSSARTKTPLVSALPTPVDVLQDQYSQLFVNLHPILLVSLLLFSFKTLVSDPVNTLIGLAPTIVLVQALYCIICLPSTGQTSPSTPKPGQKKKNARPSSDVWARVVPAFISLVLTFTLSAPLLYILVVLFGAPLTTHQPQTLLLALHLALLTTPQLFYVHGLDKETWLSIASLQLPIDEAYGMSLGACLGSWIGAVPIPLDWDREWQKWPVTIIAGMYAGAVIGKTVGRYLLRGAKMKIS